LVVQLWRHEHRYATTLRSVSLLETNTSNHRFAAQHATLRRPVQLAALRVDIHGAQALDTVRRHCTRYQPQPAKQKVDFLINIL
jgi:hypothetical protein